MAPKPLIGITARQFIRPEFSSPLIGHHLSYIEAIEAAGGIPILIPFLHDQQAIESIFRMVQGILFSGGEDVVPSYYHEDPHEKLGLTCALRDETELFLAQSAYTSKKPALGICRGTQVMNVALGGTLYQDLPSQFPGSLNHTVSKEAHGAHVTAHEISIEPGSLLGSILGADSMSVNSAHHQGIKLVPPTLRAVARAPDGVIEALEAPDHPFYIGVHPHPELLWKDQDARWAKLFQRFVKACEAPREG